MRFGGRPRPHWTEAMLTTTGRIVLTVLGGLVGLGIGSAVALTIDFPFAPAIGAAIGGAFAYGLTRLWI